MRCSARIVTKATAALAGLGLLSAALFLAALADRRPVAFESLESKTRDLKPVFNRVTFVTEGERDTWMMQQSHQGFPGSEDQWDAADRIAVAVDAGAATFLQLAPGPLAAGHRGLDQVRGFKAPCGMCHSNGPRALRPNIRSADAPLGAWDRWRVFVWNIKIKHYGRLDVAPSPSEPLGRVRVDFAAPAARLPLTVASCTACHKESGFLARGTLTKQNALAIRFMLENGFMPPFGLPLGGDDRRAVLAFVER